MNSHFPQKNLAFIYTHVYLITPTFWRVRKWQPYMNGPEKMIGAKRQNRVTTELCTKEKFCRNQDSGKLTFLNTKRKLYAYGVIR